MQQSLQSADCLDKYPFCFSTLHTHGCQDYQSWIPTFTLLEMDMRSAFSPQAHLVPAEPGETQAPLAAATAARQFALALDHP
jgi:hypothetical protein